MMGILNTILDIKFMAMKINVELDAIYLNRDEVFELREVAHHLGQDTGYITSNNKIVGEVRVFGCDIRSY